MDNVLEKQRFSQVYLRNISERDSGNIEELCQEFRTEFATVALLKSAEQYFKLTEQNRSLNRKVGELENALELASRVLHSSVALEEAKSQLQQDKDQLAQRLMDLEDLEH